MRNILCIKFFWDMILRGKKGIYHFLENVGPLSCQVSQ